MVEELADTVEGIPAMLRRTKYRQLVVTLRDDGGHEIAYNVAATADLQAQVDEAIERCAKVAEEWMQNSMLSGDTDTQEQQKTGRRIAQAIRALKHGGTMTDLAALADQECPSCHGLNLSCPDGCGRDENGELDGSTLTPSAAATIRARMSDGR